jgi:hypothetical protein
MLSPESFLRQIPHALELRARLLFEGIGWAIDSLFISFEDLKTTASMIDMDQPFSEGEHRLFVHCWSIVDQCHMLRSLLQRLPPRTGGKLEEFVGTTEKFTLIRNSMDHLSHMADNLARSKRQSTPLFGSLSWCHIGSHDIVAGKAIGATLCNVTTSNLLPNSAWDIINPAGKELAVPVCLFEFQAFDHLVSFSDLMKNVEGLVVHFEEHTRNELDERVRLAAQEEGVDPDEILKQRGGGGLKMGLRAKFD